MGACTHEPGVCGMDAFVMKPVFSTLKMAFMSARKHRIDRTRIRPHAHGRAHTRTSKMAASARNSVFTLAYSIHTHMNAHPPAFLKMATSVRNLRIRTPYIHAHGHAYTHTRARAMHIHTYICTLIHSCAEPTLFACTVQPGRPRGDRVGCHAAEPQPRMLTSSNVMCVHVA